MTPPPDPQVNPLRLARPVMVIALTVLAGLAVITAARWLGAEVGGFVEAGDEEGADVPPGQPVTIEVPAGSNAEDIGEMLVDEGVVRSTSQFEAAVNTAGVANALKAGRFELETGMNPDAVVAVLIAGPSIEVFEVTIPEGLRVTEIIDRLAEESGIDRAEFEGALTDGSVTTAFREIPEDAQLAHWEGLLFPDTYEFSEETSAVDMLQRLSRTLEVRMASVDWTAFEEAGFSQYEGIILASLIESEVRVADERPIVSSVLRNRLEAGELLGIDASTLYAQGTRDPAEIDVDFDSPYNTRRYAGLPPTPISAPGLSALQAAARPADTDFFYYVLADEDGSHAFAETIEEHNENVEIAREAGLLG